MTYILLVLTLLMGISIDAHSQQEQQTSQAHWLKYMVNPAYGGLDYSLSIDAMVRNQWVGLDQAPSMQYLSFNIPTYAIQGAVGAELARYTEGALSHIKITASYNRVFNLPFGFLSLGARTGLLHTTLDGAQLRTATGVYDVGFDHNDGLLTNDNVSSMAPYVHLGGYLFMRDAQVGVSLSRVPSYKQSIGNAGINHRIHSNFYGEYAIRYSDFLTFLPSILLKSDFISVQSDVSLHAFINGNIFGGLGIRGYNSNSIDALLFSVGVNLGKHYRLSYSYDAGLSGLRRVNEGTHELLLNYNLKKLIGVGKSPKVEYNPRNL